MAIRRVQMTKTGRLTIPADVRKEMGLTEESLLEIEVDRENDVIHLRPKATIPREDVWAYTARHRDLVKKAAEDVKAGRVHRLSEEDLKRIAD